MKFGQMTESLQQGILASRKSWPPTRAICMQVPSVVPAEVVPKMTSLSEQAKQELSCAAISYSNQVLLIDRDGDVTHATYYIPAWEDIFADDWITK